MRNFIKLKDQQYKRVDTWLVMTCCIRFTFFVRHLKDLDKRFRFVMNYCSLEGESARVGLFYGWQCVPVNIFLSSSSTIFSCARPETHHQVHERRPSVVHLWLMLFGRSRTSRSLSSVCGMESSTSSWTRRWVSTTRGQERERRVWSWIRWRHRPWELQRWRSEGLPQKMPRILERWRTWVPQGHVLRAAGILSADSLPATERRQTATSLLQKTLQGAEEELRRGTDFSVEMLHPTRCCKQMSEDRERLMVTRGNDRNDTKGMRGKKYTKGVRMTGKKIYERNENDTKEKKERQGRISGKKYCRESDECWWNTGTCRTTIPKSRPTASLTRFRTKMAPEPPSWPRRLNMTKNVARIHPHPHEAFM